MYPLLLVGILCSISSSLANNPAEINPYGQAINELLSDNIRQVRQNNGQYWWMNENSPLKKATECASKGKCQYNNGGASKPNLNKNPFLNGQIDFNKPQQPQGQYQGQPQGPAQPQGPIVGARPIQDPFHRPTAVIDINKNPFLNGQYSGTGGQVPQGQTFIGVQPSQPFGSENQNRPKGQKCAGGGYLCVEKHLCNNGVINNNGEGIIQVRSEAQFCDAHSEVCCRLPHANKQSSPPVLQGPNDLSDYVSAGKTSDPGSLIKFLGGSGLSPGSITVLKDDISNEFGDSHLGESSSKPTRQAGYPSLFQGPEYLPPLGGPTPPQSTYPNLQAPSSNFPSVVTGYLPPSSTYRPTAPSTTRPPFSYAPSTYAPTLFSPSVSVSNPSGFSTASQQYLPPFTPSTASPSSLRPTYGTPGSSLNTGYLPPSRKAPPTKEYFSPRPSPTTPFPSTTIAAGTQGYSYNPSPTPAFTDGSSNNVFISQKPYSPSTSRPQTTPGYTYPSTTRGFPSTTQAFGPSGYSYNPSPTPAFTINRPSSAFPSTTLAPGTSGYSYNPSPTPAFTINRPSSAFPSTTIAPGTSGYSYNPSPTPAFTFGSSPSSTFGSPSTIRPFTSGYSYPAPSSTPRPYTPAPSTPGYSYQSPSTPGYSYQSPSTPGYSYPSPSSPRPTTFAPTTISAGKNGYSYNPSPTPSFNFGDRTAGSSVSSSATSGYSYPSPSPSFNYGVSSTTQRPTTSPNIYLPPNPNLTPEADTSNQAYLPPDQESSGEENRDAYQKTNAGCAAALKCVQEIYCGVDGTVSATPVVITKEQELSRVPTTACFSPESGTTGVCCRDPNYKDPWPSANLVNGFDDGQYREDDSISQYKEGNFKQANPAALQRLQRHNRPTNRTDNSFVASNRNQFVAQPAQQAIEETCGVRNYNTKPEGPHPLNANFAEIPWQAMILRESNRSLLCGGAIIKRNAILTTAHCVENIQTSDILIKGGEWKLGIDEEPLPFQIVKVAVKVLHPGYTPGSLVNDLAILILEEKLRPSKNIGTICLPKPNEIPTQNCLSTGWGKRILQLHAKGAIMRSLNIKIMDSEQCAQVLQNNYQNSVPNYSPNTLCGFSANDQCKIDYGSALACSNDKNQYTLSGIFSWDTGCRDDNQIGGYIAPDVEWINTCLNTPVNKLRSLEKFP